MGAALQARWSAGMNKAVAGATRTERQLLQSVHRKHEVMHMF